MPRQELNAEQVNRAVEIYLSHAYSSALPAAVRMKVETLRTIESSELLSAPVFEQDKRSTASKLCLRLGNRFYPHMKLTIELSPDGSCYLFRADTHDRHCAPPPTSREYPSFMQLMDQNQAIAQTIETAWAEAGLPTFKTYLRDDLARRRGG